MTRVRVLGNGGSALLLGAIVRAGVDADPRRAALLDGPPGVVRARLTDLGETVSLELRDGELRCASGEPTAPPDIEVVGDSESLVRLLAAPRLAGLPNPLRRAGREAIRRVASGRVRTDGVLRGRRLAERLHRLLTTDP